MKENKEGKKMTYKVSTNMADNDYYTNDEQDAINKFQTYIVDYGDGIRLYEAEMPDNDEDAPDWDCIDSYDEDDFEEAPDSKEGLHTQGDRKKIIGLETPLGIANIDANKEWDYDGNDKETYSLFHNREFFCELNTGEDNASLITHYLNERKALLDALKSCYNCLTMDSDMEKDFAPQIKQVKKLLDKAGW